MAWKFESGRPIYAQIAEYLTMDILSGVYPPGERLPTVREFASCAAVNPNTMQKALLELEHIGLVSTQRSTGRFVTTDTDIIRSIAKQKLHALTEEYLQKLSILGYSGSDAVTMIQEYKKEVPAGDRTE